MGDILNLGKASIKVEVLDSLPNVAKDKNVFNFDIHAGVYNSLGTLGMGFPPVFLENIKDDKGFATFYPEKRKYAIDNFIADAKGQSTTASKSNKPYLLWKPTTIKQGMIQAATEKYDQYDLQFAPNYGPSYLGPKWSDNALRGEAPPDDDALLAEWLRTVRGQTNTTTTAPASTPSSSTPIPSTSYVNQTVVRDGLWWGIESSPFLKENTPFWVTINRAQQPSSSDKDSFLFISLGIDDEKNAFDLYIGLNKKPIMVDYSNGRSAKSGGMPVYKMQTFSDDLSRIWREEPHIELGFMTVGGRLVIFANKTVLLYTRTKDQVNNEESGKKGTPPQDSGQVMEAKIGAGRIRIYGSNCQMNINVSPMTFAPIGVAALPLPVVQVDDTNPNASGATTPAWAGVTFKNESSTTSVAKMPQDPSTKNSVYGTDCEKFYSDTGNSSPEGFALHKKGEIYFIKASSVDIVQGNNRGDYYILVMKCTNEELDLGGKANVAIPNSGCPYFFRLKGRYEIEGTGGSSGSNDISQDVISASEQYAIDDYFMISGTASITLYNKDGKYDNAKFKQKGIRISWGWNGSTTKTFTGLITGISSSEVPGKEELTLTCSDYMFLLKNSMIMNSPYYDGMVLFYACKDVIKRAGILNITNDWGNTDDYYLPSGYAFTKPAVRFDDGMMLYDCVKSMVQRAEATVYFDQDGTCHIMKLPGGLFSVGSTTSTVATFTRNPNTQQSSGTTFTMLDTKNVEYDYSETVNRITVFSVDRDTRDGIVYTKSASGKTDNLLYRRVFYLQKPELGRYNVVVRWVDELAQRAFYPVRKTSFKTVGSSSIIYPLSFCTADGLEYRIVAVSRKYDSASNDFTNEFNCEWLGGK